MEVALDTGSIAAGEARTPIHELELELHEGAPSAVFRMALALHAATPVAIEAESKVSRGLRLRRNAGPSAREASPPPLDPEASAAEAFSVIAMNALGHLVANREAASARLAEGIHQTRVAIRRLRTALRLFEPWLEPHAANLFQGELQRLGRVIGEARDWDVFCDEMVGSSFSPEDADWARLLSDAAAEPRAKADQASAGEVDSAAFTALALGLSAWAQSGRERRELLGDKRLERKIADVASALLGRLARKVEKRGPRPRARRDARGASSPAQGAQEVALRRRVLRPDLSAKGRETGGPVAEATAKEPRRHQRCGRRRPPGREPGAERSHGARTAGGGPGAQSRSGAREGAAKASQAVARLQGRSIRSGRDREGRRENATRVTRLPQSPGFGARARRPPPAPSFSWRRRPLPRRPAATPRGRRRRAPGKRSKR